MVSDKRKYVEKGNIVYLWNDKSLNNMMNCLVVASIKIQL